ncbi:MAG: alpha/beta hydrolase [Chloroflexi bacterium]|nr:alpha/beta hydrolase [Chloroflexota bacterium]
MPFFSRDGLAFHYRDQGAGLPFVFQHGLGGDAAQTFGLFKPPAGIRLLTLECRGHGETRPLGDLDKLSYAALADDVYALLDYLQLPQVILGGISMGAGIALNLALRFPQRICGLVLSRPAALDQPLPPNAAVFPQIAQLIERHGAQDGLELFERSALYRNLVGTAPDVARSLRGQFEHPRAEETAAKLARIPNTTPIPDLIALASIAAPALVLANRQDPVHPFEYGEIIARALPNAELKELTAKSVSFEQHAQQTQDYIEQFLLQFI